VATNLLVDAIQNNYLGVGSVSINRRLFSWPRKVLLLLLRLLFRLLLRRRLLLLYGAGR
jgi:hypothetical protein